MSDDARIHLYLDTDELEIRCGIYFPNLDETYGLLLNYLSRNELKGIEALVRSLAADPIRYKKCPFCDDTYSLEQIAQAVDMDVCLKQKEFKVFPEFYWSKQPILIEKNEKLKLTFGAGTYISVFQGKAREVIEPLQPIFKLCHELGIEVFFE